MGWWWRGGANVLRLRWDRSARNVSFLGTSGEKEQLVRTKNGEHPSENTVARLINALKAEQRKGGKKQRSGHWENLANQRQESSLHHRVGAEVWRKRGRACRAHHYTCTKALRFLMMRPTLFSWKGEGEVGGEVVQGHCAAALAGDNVYCPV